MASITPQTITPQENGEGMGEVSVAALNMTESITNGVPGSSLFASWTDITLDQALGKLKEIDKENVFLKEHLADNTHQIKIRFDRLAELRQKDQDMIERYKALIMSLREDVKEMGGKETALKEREREMEKSLEELRTKNSHLQREKELGVQRAFNIFKEAERQGVTGLENVDIPQDTETVFVLSEENEKQIEVLQASLSGKDEIIASLQKELLTANDVREKYKSNNEVLLKDMEGLQRQKEQLDQERRKLYDDNTRLNKEFDQLMQSNIASTKKVIEDKQFASSGGEENPDQANQMCTTSGSSDFLDDAENLEDLFARKLDIQKHEEQIQGLKEELENVKEEKAEAEEKLSSVMTDYKDLQSQHTQAQEKMDLLETEKITLAEEFEQNLTSITHQRLESTQQKIALEDQSFAQSQVVSLVNEIDELNQRLSASHMALAQKDKRINELAMANGEWKDHWNATQSMIQTLQNNLRQEEVATQRHVQEHSTTKHEYQKLQDSFNGLVNDYKDLLEMFEMERGKAQQGMSKDLMEKMDTKTAQIIAAEEAINYRDIQLAELEEKVKLLNFQLETYQSDFQTERESRSKIAQEKNEIEEKLQKKQQEIKMLMEQMRLLQKGQGREQYDRSNSQFGSGGCGGGGDASIHQMQNRFQQQAIGGAVGGAVGGAMGGACGFAQTPIPMMNAMMYDDQDGDQFPSMTHQCPRCSKFLPDMDSLQLHVADCID